MSKYYLYQVSPYGKTHIAEGETRSLLCGRSAIGFNPYNHQISEIQLDKEIEPGEEDCKTCFKIALNLSKPA